MLLGNHFASTFINKLVKHWSNQPSFLQQSCKTAGQTGKWVTGYTLTLVRLLSLFQDINIRKHSLDKSSQNCSTTSCVRMQAWKRLYRKRLRNWVHLTLPSQPSRVYNVSFWVQHILLKRWRWSPRSPV